MYRPELKAVGYVNVLVCVLSLLLCYLPAVLYIPNMPLGGGKVDSRTRTLL